MENRIASADSSPHVNPDHLFRQVQTSTQIVCKFIKKITTDLIVTITATILGQVLDHTPCSHNPST
jgi:hypothetical protein